MKKGIVTTIAINDGYVKLLKAKTQHNLPLVTHGAFQRLKENSAEEITEALAKMISSKDVDSENLTLIIPRRIAILKQLFLPSQNEEEIQRMIALQIHNQIPFTKEEIIFDYSILKRENSGYTRILVVVVRKEDIFRYMRIFNKIGLHPHKVGLSSFGVINWFYFQMGRLKKIDPQPCVIVNLDEETSEICFCQDQLVFFSRSINMGVKDLVKENGGETLIEQIGLSLGSYKKEQWGDDIKKLIIISYPNKFESLIEHLKKYYRLAVESFSPLDDLPCEKNFDLKILGNQEGLSFIENLGFLSEDMGRQINLLPRELISTKRLKIRRKVTANFLLSLILTFILGIASLGVGIYRESAYLKKIETQIEEIKIKTEKAREYIQFLQFARQQTEERILIADIIKELYRLTPNEVSFRSLQIDHSGVLLIEGSLETGASINQFQSQLVGSPFFKEVALQYATKRMRFNKEYTEFKIVCKLRARKESKQ